MKVKLEKNYKDFYTVSEYENAKAVIESMKEDTTKPAEYLEMAGREWCRENGFSFFGIFGEAEAETKLGAEYNAICENSGRVDVDIRGYFTAYRPREGYSPSDLHYFEDFIIEIHAPLTAIWQIDGETNVFSPRRVYAKKYREA